MCPPHILKNAEAIKACDPIGQEVSIAHFWPVNCYSSRIPIFVFILGLAFLLFAL